jgi:hypothetical protein
VAFAARAIVTTCGSWRARLRGAAFRWSDEPIPVGWANHPALEDSPGGDQVGGRDQQPPVSNETARGKGARQSALHFNNLGGVTSRRNQGQLRIRFAGTGESL